MTIKKLTEEVDKVSNVYVKKFNIKKDNDWFVLKLQEELGELTQSYLRFKGKGKTNNKSQKELKADFAKEIADLFCHTLLLANDNDIDLEKEVKDKWLVWSKNKK